MTQYAYSLCQCPEHIAATHAVTYNNSLKYTQRMRHQECSDDFAGPLLLNVPWGTRQLGMNVGNWLQLLSQYRT